jgi:predicted O-methyltransferase YrrM
LISHPSRSLERVLSELEDRERAEKAVIDTMSVDEFMARREDFLISIGRSTGQFLSSLILASQPRRILELGTGHGYSTLWLASAAAQIGATVTTVERAEAKVTHAKAMASAAGLSEAIRFVTADALDFVPTLSDRVDLVLIDVWKEAYIDCFDVCAPILSDRGLVVADNMLFPERLRPAGVAYRQHIRHARKIESIVLPIGNGLDLAAVGAHVAEQG